MADIARAVGVSTITVSRALRSPEMVSPETRRRIAEAISQFGYVPNLLAGSLAADRTNVVTAIFPSIQNSLFASTIQGISDVLREHGYYLMLGHSNYSLDEAEALVAAALAVRPCGMVLHNTTHTPRATALLTNAGVPVVETGELKRRPLDVVVSYSNGAAARAMTLHLATRGYRRIGFVSVDPRGNERARLRRQGYRAALKEAGILHNPRLERCMPQGFAGGAQALVDLLETEPRLEAVFFAGDVFAYGALFECQRRGWAVPDRIAIAGFDNLGFAEDVVPTLTTLRIPRYNIGRRAAEIILDRLAGRDGTTRRIDVGFEVVRREST
jgi:LacI family gluconate utilization system Gnt-I transcriptional repressor